MDGFASEVSYFSAPLLNVPQPALYILAIIALVYLIVAIKTLGFGKVLISLLLGGIASRILLFYLELKYDAANIPHLTVWLWQTLFFAIVFIYILLLLQSKRESLEEGNQAINFKKFGRALQILLVFLTVSIVYLPILGNFFFIISIVLLFIGTISYYKTKSKADVSLIVWGSVILVLAFLMNLLTYGTL
ncbi:MAG: hypothetical protein PHG06_21580 [Parabacteroides sp.]|nr:hypothetical protein [Eubacteriales bacterium]MDD4592985.1 hypothetical protein [Parabacteroides sp.]